MPLPSIAVTYNNTIRDIVILENYRRDSLNLEPKFQHFIAEIILLRLFSILENTLMETAQKIACQAPYRNGTVPTLMLICRSSIDANYQFANYNRTKPQNTKWTMARFVNDTIKKVIPPTEPYRVNINNHALTINELRVVRNHIAHRTSSTLNEYKGIINTVFGAKLNIQPGAYLTSTKRLTSPKIDFYIRAVRIIVHDITNG